MDADTEHERELLVRRLSAGQDALARIRCRVSGTLLAFGSLSLVLVGYVFFHVDEDKKSDSNGRLGTTCFSLSLYMIAFGLAPMPDDIWLTRVAIAAHSLLLFVFVCYSIKSASHWYSYAICNECHLFNWSFQNEVCFWWGMMDTVNLAASAWSIFFCFKAFCSPTSSDMQAGMWRGLTPVLVVVSLSAFCNTVIVAATQHRLARCIWELAWTAPTLIVVRWPSLRQAIQSHLRTIYTFRTETAASAGIAGLIGNCSVKDSLKEARARFRCLPLSALALDDFSSSPVTHSHQGRPLFEHTRPCRFRECDAFISHSWHDPAELRYAALQEWRSAFKAKHLREPWVWFDKACIDQTDIAADLRVLPLFLAGSKELLVLCGPTYLGRLWCIVELFTFAHMGGDHERMRVIGLAQSLPAHGQSRHSVFSSLNDFDARACSCYLEEDKHKMLGIIDVAFGSLDSFNHVVRRLFENPSSDEDTNSSVSSIE